MEGDGGGEEEVADAAGFVADGEGAGAGEVGGVEGRAAAGDGGEEFETVATDEGEGFRGGEGEVGEAEEGTGGGAEGFGVVGADGAFEEEGSGGAEGFGGAEEGAGVAGVLDLVEEEEEGRAGEELVGGPRGGAHEGDDALGGFGAGETGEEGFVEGEEAGGGMAAEEALDLGQEGGGGEDGGDVAGGAEGFFEQVEGAGDGETGGGEGSALDGAADVAEQGVVGAGDGFRAVHDLRRIKYPTMKRLVALLVLVVAIPLGAYLAALAKEIERQSLVDEAERADVIVVLGAAEYNGRPSPVLKARLDHALELFERGIAPRLLTSGGAGGDPQFTEGEVGRDYLVRQGVPSEAITVESEGGSTVHTLVAVAEIMRRMSLESAVVVSDGYHIYRAKRILEHEGMLVYGSPRPSEGKKGGWRHQWLYVRQAIGYVLWRAGINI